MPISSEHRRDRGPSKQRHGIGSRIVQLAVLAALATRPRGADDEDVACGGGSLGLIAARNVHWLEYALASLDVSSSRHTIGGQQGCAANGRLGTVICQNGRDRAHPKLTVQVVGPFPPKSGHRAHPALTRGQQPNAKRLPRKSEPKREKGMGETHSTVTPSITRRIIITRRGSTIPTSRHNLPFEIHTQPFAEHVVLRIRHQRRRNQPSTRRISSGNRLNQITSSKSAWIVTTPHQ